ncbi:MAG: queA [Bacteriovoracaceae bacterium]|nr:queA [Bacteriovoracaceae bacterium]
MNISDFHFVVPPELIAVAPVHPRSQAKLLTYQRVAKELKHSNFEQLPEFLLPGDLVIFNNTFVIPARFYGSRETGAKIEGLLLQTKSTRAKVWIRGKAHPGDRLNIDGFGKVEVLSKNGKQIELNCSRNELAACLEKCGSIPIPPYIVSERARRKLEAGCAEDKESYQTIFAKKGEDFSVAAPTASLHFDDLLLEKLKERGVEMAEISLHVGEGTFAPVDVGDLSKHQMHSEEVQIPPATWKKIEKAKSDGRRVIAVGTTVCRSLESAAERAEKNLSMDSFSTNLFIRPPFKFKVIDGLITNFHWPDSTLVVLVATFLEAKKGRCDDSLSHDWRKIYDEAISEKYQLFSYGDGMLIL